MKKVYVLATALLLSMAAVGPAFSDNNNSNNSNNPPTTAKGGGGGGGGDSSGNGHPGRSGPGNS